MGATDAYARYPGDLTKDQLVKVFNGLQASLRHEHGHGGYSGTLAEARGLEFVNQTFPTVDAAQMALIDRAKKYGPALVAKTEDGHWALAAIVAE